MKLRRRQNLLLPYSAMLLLALGAASAARADDVTLELAKSPDQGGQAKPAEDSNPAAWTRKLWTGSFDRAADASGAAAKRLDNLDYGDCQRYLKQGEDASADPKKAAPNADQNGAAQTLYQACVQRKQSSKQFAAEARSIEKQQNVMSLVSKAGDVAAVGAVAGVAYAEVGVKQGSQSNTYQSAANIEQTAAQASYVTGAADLTMGAYAYVAQKRKLEEIQSQVSGTAGGVQASSDPAVKNALTNAVEAAKKAAYSHMMWGAGKLAAGYGMMYLAQQSQNQAAQMQSMQDLQEQNMIMQQELASGNVTAAQQAAVVANASGQVPYYQNNTPTFSLPGSGTTALGSLAKTGGTLAANGAATGSSTGASAPLSASAMRAPASATTGKSASGASSAGGAAAGGAGGGDAADPGAAKADKATKEALGSSFEMQLSGGTRAYGGGGSGSASKDEIPNLASLMGGGSAAGSGDNGLNPARLFRDAQEGMEGAEQGSMAGVSGKSETSLFEITTAKLTKMFQSGNVGSPKNVEVKN